MKSYHLGFIKHLSEQSHISSLMLKYFHLHNNAAFIIFSSPETLLKSSLTKFIDSAIANDFLTMACVDEMNLFVDHGCRFRNDFQSLKRIFLS